MVGHGDVMLDLQDKEYVLCNSNTILRFHKLWIDMKDWYGNAKKGCWWKLLKKDADESCWKRMLMKTAEEGCWWKLLKKSADGDCWESCWSEICWRKNAEVNCREKILKWVLLRRVLLRRILSKKQTTMMIWQHRQRFHWWQREWNGRKWKFFHEKKKFHFCNKKYQSANFSLLNLRC